MAGCADNQPGNPERYQKDHLVHRSPENAPECDFQKSHETLRRPFWNFISYFERTKGIERWIDLSMNFICVSFRIFFKVHEEVKN